MSYLQASHRVARLSSARQRVEPVAISQWRLLVPGMTWQATWKENCLESLWCPLKVNVAKVAAQCNIGAFMAINCFPSAFSPWSLVNNRTESTPRNRASPRGVLFIVPWPRAVSIPNQTGGILVGALGSSPGQSMHGQGLVHVPLQRARQGTLHCSTAPGGMGAARRGPCPLSLGIRTPYRTPVYGYQSLPASCLPPACCLLPVCSTGDAHHC